MKELVEIVQSLCWTIGILGFFYFIYKLDQTNFKDEL
jgi:hypothetical protein